MNLKQIQELIKFVAKSGATEVDLEIGDVKICIKSPPKGKINIENIASNIVQPPVVQPPVSESKIPDLVNTETVEQSKSSDQYITVKSPIIGTFYRRPSPDKDPFVNVGDKIDVGSIVGIVEAMKLFNEIESEISGKIVEVLVDDATPIEFDQPLFLVDPS